MSKNGFVFRIIGAVLLIALLVAGGTFVYRAGVAQGISQAPQVAEAIQQSAENGNSMPMFNRGYGYGYPYHHGFGFGPHFGFFPFGFCFSILFLFFFFGLLRFTFRPWAWGKHGHGYWEGKWENRFDEWHKRAHGENTESKSENS
ncbi:MAG TPA: hypothetical protein DEP19_01090 [Anaerolineae bacterium]|nr:hypothetical protein [Anaerolineae bacterium]